MSAVAARGFGRHPVKPCFMVEMISLYCSVVRATVRLFILHLQSSLKYESSSWEIRTFKANPLKALKTLDFGSRISTI